MLFFQRYFSLFLLVSAASLPTLLSAQTGQLRKPLTGNDSSLLLMQELLQKSEAQRLRDSIRSVVLTEELQSLKRSSGTATILRNELAEIQAKDSLRLAHQIASIDSLRAKTTGAPVCLLQDTLFYFYASLGPFSPATRANSASLQLDKLYEQAFFIPDSLRTESRNSFINLYYGNRIITSFNETDALWANQSLDSLTTQRTQQIRQRILEYRELYSLQNFSKRIAKAAFVLLVAFGVFLGLRFVSEKIKLLLLRATGYFQKGIKISNYQLLTNEQIWTYLMKMFRILRGILFILLVYITLSMVFSLFPATNNWTDTLTHWIRTPLLNIASALYHYLPNLFTIAIIVTIARYTSRLFRYFSLEIERGILQINGFHKEWARPTYRIIRFLWYAFIFVLIFPYLPGSDSIAFKGVSVFLGILFSIGSSSAIANTVAGFVITYMRPFRTGDWIRIGEITGVVVEKTFLVTRIRTINNEDVTVPNSAILAGHTINYSSSSAEKGLVISAKASFIYSIPWQQVHSLLTRAALITTDVDATREPFIFQVALNDFYAVYQVNTYTHKPERMFHIHSELHQHIQDLCKEAGIEMSIPHPVDLKNSASAPDPGQP